MLTRLVRLTEGEFIALPVGRAIPYVFNPEGICHVQLHALCVVPYTDAASFHPL
jgi:hypothetical protein